MLVLTVVCNDTCLAKRMMKLNPIKDTAYIEDIGTDCKSEPAECSPTKLISNDSGKHVNNSNFIVVTKTNDAKEI